MHAKQGNVGLADGSVQGWSRSRLQDALKNTGDYGASAPGSFAGCSRLQPGQLSTASRCHNPKNLA